MKKERMKNFTMLLSVVILFQTGCNFSENENFFQQEYIKNLMIKVTKWQLNNPKHELCDWTNGAFYSGMFAAWKTTGSDEIYKALMDMGEKTGWKPCNTWNLARANDITISQTHVELYRIEKKDVMIRPFIDSLNVFMTREFPVQGMFVQEWWWCDALFMAPPSIVKLGVTLNNMDYLRYNDKMFRSCYDLLYDKEEHLFARDILYLIKGTDKDIREANGQKIFWGRGNGWVAGGLTLVLDELPSDYPERPFYENMFKEMMTKLASIQQPDGLWRCSLLDPDSYPGGEVSGSGFFCYAMAWGINNGLLDKKIFLPVVKKAWIGLNGCLNDEGRLGWVQPIGDNPKKNFSENSWEVYGTGAFLLAGSEVIKLKK